MSSRKGGGKPLPTGTRDTNSSQRGKNVERTDYGRTNYNPNQASHDMSNLNMHASHDGEWETIEKKSRNRAGTGSVVSNLMPGSNYNPRAWPQPEGMQRQSRGPNGGVPLKTTGTSWAQMCETSDLKKLPDGAIPKSQSTSRGWESAYMTPIPTVPIVAPPLEGGWQWASRPGSKPKHGEEAISETYFSGSANENDFESDKASAQPDAGTDDEDFADSDDDLSDDSDSGASDKSHDTRKKNKWFKAFFEALDRLTVEELSEPTRQWHCPACHNGPGAIDWYKGLQPLMTHAKTKGSTRVKVHRELAALLDEELQRRGTSVVPTGEVFGKWKGLRETATDHEIVWPPMIVVMNTLLEQGENEKWIGMGNQELLEYFHRYAAVKARHAYGPRGHRGMSVLIFEANAMGFLEAERLHKHFSDEGTDRDAWQQRPRLFLPGGKRQLYGYLARKEDMESFNQHCKGKSCLKFELKSYQEMVVIPMKQMSEDNQQLVWFKNKVYKSQQRNKALEETVEVVSQKLRETMEENRIVRLRTKIQHEENKEEMDYQERFFKEQIEKVHKATEEKERDYERLLQQERAKAKQSDVDSGTREDRELRKEEIARFIDSQADEVFKFEEERERLILDHQEKKVELKKKHLAEEVELEKEFDASLTELMEKYRPLCFKVSSST